MCVLPGLVDAHTHPVWAGDRVHEFSMKLAGATYLDIHKVFPFPPWSTLLLYYLYYLIFIISIN
jgi:hypothetical protein